MFEPPSKDPGEGKELRLRTARISEAFLFSVVTKGQKSNKYGVE